MFTTILTYFQKVNWLPSWNCHKGQKTFLADDFKFVFIASAHLYVRENANIGVSIYQHGRDQSLISTLI